jgi:alanine racemase
MGGYYGKAWGELLHHGLTPVVYERGQIEALADEVRFAGAEPVSIHLKIDTGMGRLGVMPRELAEIGSAIASRPELSLQGLMTHFACADTSLESINEQLDCFDRASAELDRLGLRASVRHAANSAALLSCERSHLDLVRPGIALFGVQPALGMGPGLRPVMRVRSEIIALRDLERGQTTGYGATWTAERPSKIATIPLGYADGLSRIAGNNGDVLVRGKRAPIVGAISMDLTTIDVTEIEGVQITDEIVMLGTQAGPLGEDTISAAEIAVRQNTISWEVLTNVSRRVPRFYRES